MIYVGDISKLDAKLIVSLAKRCKSVLEFGVGGSTMLIAQAIKPGCRFITTDSDAGWIDRVQKMVGELPRAVMPEFHLIPYHIVGPFDFIFVDGVDQLRCEFARVAWYELRCGGVMAFHDTTRQKDADNVLATVSAHYLEVDKVLLNYNGTNISLIYKRKPVVFEDWNQAEKREPWQSGSALPPDDWMKRALRA